MATVEQQRDAYRVGLTRFAAARARGGTHRYDWPGSPPADDASRRDFDGQSAVAEFLVAEAIGKRWLSDGVIPDEPLAGDVEGGLQVRWTAHLSGHLIVHDNDPDGMICVLVVGRAPRMRIVGWMNAIEAKTPAFWRDDVPHPAYFVPQSVLSPISLLAKALA